VGEIEDFDKVRASLSQVDNVAGIVPMGITITTVFGGNEIDQVITDLRAAVRDEDAEAISVLSARLRRIAESIQKDYGVRSMIASDPEKVRADSAALSQAISDAFWADFSADPYAVLDFFDARIAPLAADGRLLYLRIIGTDPERFAESFDKFYIVDGQMIPPGKRGLLLSKRTYEALVKNKVARDLDDIHEQVVEGTRIADDPLLQEQIARNVRQYQRIVFQLSPEDAVTVEAKLRALLPEAQGDLTALVQAFLAVDDTNIEARYAFFYAEIAPKIRLYDFEVGDVLTLRAYTKSGYVKSVNVRIYGTYEFEGLEKSDLASASNLTDLITWRELYGKMSADQRDELATIKTDVGVREIDRASAEDALFGGPASSEATTTAAVASFDEFAGVALSNRTTRLQELDTHVYSREDFEHGLALNAAILLKDKDRIAETQRAVQEAIDRDDLGIQVVDWQTASGLIGQFIIVMRLVLYVAIFVVFLVALVIINNSMVMATIERTAEIGTMRAVGAQRAFVIALFLLETILLGTISGGLGALAGAGFIRWLGHVGIPAGTDILVVLFAGPRLYPAMGLGNLLFGVVVILVVSVLSTLYPAFLAARVPPVVAMQGKE
jgi:ABC-type antimicrobial peptide transport system permease subunit